MVLEREITVEGNGYTIVISDETEALLAARAAGRVPVGLIGSAGADSGDGQKNGTDFGCVRYLVESTENLEDYFLERVVRRELGLPWMIAESERLVLREFSADDWMQVPEEPQYEESDRIFCDQEKLASYVRGQYGFYEYGIWAAVRKSDQKIIGKAGVIGFDEEEDSMEMGYHVFEPYRRQGYGLEVCRMIVDYIHEELELPVCAVVKKENQASQRLLKKLGLKQIKEKNDRILFRE